MKTHVTAARAVAVLYARKLFRRAALPVLLMGALILGATLYLMFAVSMWWAVFLIPLLFSAMVVYAVWMTIHSLTARLLPQMNPGQKKAVLSFIGQVEQAAGQLQTPPYIMLYRVIKDTLFHKEQRFLLEVTAGSVGLKAEFERLSALFGARYQ